MPSPKRQLTAIMFTDIVGYTALMGRDSNKAMELVRKSKEIQKTLVEKHNGKWIKEMGDGALASFESALDAVNCAWDIQRASRADFEGDLRIGIHSGDITIEDNDVYGDGVNVAARLESIADPGGIYVSESIEKAIRGQTDKQAKFLGALQLKNVDYEVRTYALQGVGLPVPNPERKKQLTGTRLAELKRRGIIRSGVVYILLSVLLYLLLPYLNSWMVLPDWTNTAVIAVLIAGFLLALYLAWRFERSPEGFVQTKSPQSWQNPYSASKRKPLTNNVIVAGLVALILGVYFYPEFSSGDRESDVTKTISNSGEIEKTLAVLPFVNDSPEEENEYFCNGMMDEILSHLQKIAALGVKSRTDVEKYRNATQSIASIAKELDVAFVLEGAVRKYGNRFRVTAQLIDASSGNHMWAETYDGTFSDTIFTVQTDIAKKVAYALNTVITPEEEEIIHKIPTASIDAYNLFIQAQYEVFEYWKDFEKERLVASKKLLDQALTFDSLYIDAIAGKGTAFLYQLNSDSALLYAERTIDLDPGSNRGYILMGDIYQHFGKSDQAVEYYEKAITLPPKDQDWLKCYMKLATIYGYEKKDFRKAIPNFRFYYEAAKKKRSVGVAEVYSRIAQVFFYNGAYDKAMHYYDKGFEMRDHANWYTWNYNTCLLIQGKISEAIQFIDSICAQSTNTTVCNNLMIRISSLTGEFAEAERVYQLSKDLQLLSDVETYMVYIFSELGKKEAAAQLENEILIKELNSNTIRQSLNLKLLNLSRLYAYKGDRDKSLEYLRETAIYGGFNRGWHDFIMIDPMFESLREDPEFLRIVRKAQEEKAATRAQIEEMVENGELDWLKE